MAVQHFEEVDLHDAEVHHLPTTRNDATVAEALEAFEDAAADLIAAVTAHAEAGGNVSAQLTVLTERAAALRRGAHFQRTGRVDHSYTR